MSHRIVGLDLGTYSIKVVRIESSFRSHSIAGFAEERLSEHRVAVEPHDDGDERDDAEVESAAVLSALRALQARGLLEGDLLVVGYGLERCIQAATQLPFTQRRQIEQVLPVQIEDRLPIDIDELTLEFQPSEQPERGDGGPPMHRIDVIATPTEDLGAFLAMLGSLDLDPRIVEPGPARLKTAYQFLAEPSLYGGAVALVDVGHQFTDVCLVEDDAIRGMRRLHFGGDHVTRALAAQLGVTLEEAEYRKVTVASLDVSEAAPVAGTPQQLEMRSVCQQQAILLVDELRRTFQSHLARGGKVVERIALCGGGALLRGLPQFLAADLDLRVEPLQVQAAISAGGGAPVRAVGALGLAARGLEQRGASRFNMRRGLFAFRGDFEFLRARSRPLAVISLLLVFAFVFMLLAQRWALTARRDAYADALCSATEAVLGQCIRNPGEAITVLAGGNPPVDLPDHSAYEIFRDISAELVYLREDVEVPLEVERMTVDIQRDVVSLRGTTDSAESVDEIVLQLGTLECLDGVGSESTNQNRSTGLFEFVLRARNKCL